MNDTVTHQTVDVLNRLIEVCKDSENGFRTASEESTDGEFSALCLQYSQQRGGFASELQEEVSRLGEKPKSAGTVTGSLKRGWMNVKSAVSSESEDRVIEQCEQAEDDIKAAYETALKSYLPTTITTVLQRQYEKVREGHDRFSAMQKAMLMTLKLRYDGGERPWKIVNATTGHVVDALDDRHRAETSMISRMISDPAPLKARKKSLWLTLPASPSGRSMKSK